MKRFMTIIVIIFCITSLNSCKYSSDSTRDVPKTDSNLSERNLTEPDDSPSSENPAIPPADAFEITGTIVYKNLEGGFFAIDGDDGNKYNPINLPESFKKDGLKVKLSARYKKDAMSIHMYGAIIDIVNITAK